MLGFGAISESAIGDMPHDMARDILHVISQSSTPVEDAKEILIALKKVSDTNDYSTLNKNDKFNVLKKWIPDTPEKLAAYAAIVALIFQLISKEEAYKIEVNNTFIQQYYIIVNNNSALTVIDEKD